MHKKRRIKAPPNGGAFFAGARWRRLQTMEQQRSEGMTHGIFRPGVAGPLIQCEAGGEGENGMKAVAGVVMNRVHATGGEYARVGQGSIRNIIFQPYQFVCASETRKRVYNPQNIYNMRPEQIHYDIADWAIAGNRLPDVAESLWFYNPFGPQVPALFSVGCGLLADPDRRPLLL